MKEIILASASPRRKEIMSLMNLDFTVQVSDADEHIGVNTNLSPVDFSLQIAKNKSTSVAYFSPNALTIGADTIVVLDNCVLEKPKDENDAIRMLNMLSANWHTVYTSAWAVCEDKEEGITCATRVKFAKMSDDEIFNYVSTAEPMDKAGSYGIQGIGGMFIEQICGCYFNVMGLPMHELYMLLQRFGIDAMQFKQL